MMEFVNGKDDIPYMKWKIKNAPNHQPVIGFARRDWSSKGNPIFFDGYGDYPPRYWVA